MSRHRPLWQNTKAEITAQALWGYGWYIGWGAGICAVLLWWRPV